MNKIKVVLLICFAHLSVYSQVPSISWGEYDKTRGLLTTSIVPVNETDFYDVTDQGFTYFQPRSRLRIRFCKNSNVVNEKKVLLKKKYESFQEAILVNNKMVLITSVSSGKNVTYYAYEVTSNLGLGKAKKIFSRKFKGGETPRIQVNSSTNGGYFGFMLSYQDRKDDALNVRFKLFNANLEEIKSGSVSVPFNRRDADFDSHHISNSGDYFVGYKIYETNNRGKVNKRAAVKEYVIRHNFEGGHKNYKLNLKDAFVKDVFFSSDDTSFLFVSGLYGGYERSIEGVFTLKIDYISQEVLEEHREPFSRDFILSTFKENKREKYEEDEDKKLKNKDLKELSNYVYRAMIPTAEGSVVLMEEYYVIEVHRTDKDGFNYVDYIYYIKGVIAYLIRNDGSIGWINYMHKEHITRNDGGLRSSFGYLYNDNFVSLLFNDSKKCYDSDGNYNDLRIRSAFVKGSYAFSCATIDVKTGKIERRMIHDYKSAKGIVIPRYLARTKKTDVAILPMYKNNMLLGGKKRYGTVRI